MADERAIEIIKEQEREEQNASNFRNLYQEVADHMLPRENQIIGVRTPGEDKSKQILDPTAMLDLQDMVSGLSAAFFPPGELAFGLTVKNRQLANVDAVKRYLALATQITHDELFASNFMLQLNETLSSLIGFGTGCLYSEWNLGLNFKDWDISFYTIKQNSAGLVDTLILKYPLTARQAVQEFGQDNVSEKVLKAFGNPETISKPFNFIHRVGPRAERNRKFTDFRNMPWESLYVNIEEQIIIKGIDPKGIDNEGGFDEFPYAVPRWKKSSNEKYGRGQGTVALSVSKELQQMHADFIECGNKWNNPPREILDTAVEGRVDVRPGASNRVTQMGSIKALDAGIRGNFPITREILEFAQGILHRIFFKDVFAPLAELTGDRRTTLEIRERVKQAAKKLGSPLYRLQSELLTPNITRNVLLLIRNGVIPQPPVELRGQGFGIEYISELALAMRDQQSRAFVQFADLVSALDPVFPGAKDVVNIDRALPDIGFTFGLKVEHLNTQEEIDEIRRVRAEDLAEQKAMELAQMAAQGYGQITKAPESGSLAEIATGV
jgi:hypothetical protein